MLAYRSARVSMLAAAVVLSGISLLTASGAEAAQSSATSPASTATGEFTLAVVQRGGGVGHPGRPLVPYPERHRRPQRPARFLLVDGTYRDDIAKIVCYESTFNYHAENVGQYGWFQMNQPLIESEGVTWDQYWGGSSSEHPGWYQCTAGERYIHDRYRNPAVAWLHEQVYGWY